MYLKVSPFMYANKINEPILLTHGEADDNTGTFQSIRTHVGAEGNGATVAGSSCCHYNDSYAGVVKASSTCCMK